MTPYLATRIRYIAKRYLRLTTISTVVLSVSILMSSGTAGQTPKKKSASATGGSCVYGSRFFRLHSYQTHGITCQQCTDGNWVVVGGQYCAASKPEREVGQHAKAKKHLCTKEGSTFSVGAVYYDGADDCSLCADRDAPNDWDALDKRYFCENANPEGDASAMRRGTSLDQLDQDRSIIFNR